MWWCEDRIHCVCLCEWFHQLQLQVQWLLLWQAYQLRTFLEEEHTLTALKIPENRFNPIFSKDRRFYVWISKKFIWQVLHDCTHDFAFGYVYIRLMFLIVVFDWCFWLMFLIDVFDWCFWLMFLIDVFNWCFWLLLLQK